MSAKFVEFPGNRPGNVTKAGKYSVRYENGEYVVGLYYQSTDDETWHPTTDQHPKLVEQVNEIKRYFSGAPGGSFYINEYKQVLVPAGPDTTYYYAGEYHHPLVFEFEGHRISGEALDSSGKPIFPGDPWFGPHAGIPYVLAAGGKDIYYKFKLRPGVEKKVSLSRCIGKDNAEQVARQISEFKNSTGGGIYVNEFCNAFAPKETGFGLEYIFLLKIDLDNWFPKPEIAELETAATD